MSTGPFDKTLSMLQRIQAMPGISTEERAALAKLEAETREDEALIVASRRANMSEASQPVQTMSCRTDHDLGVAVITFEGAKIAPRGTEIMLNADDWAAVDQATDLLLLLAEFRGWAMARAHLRHTQASESAA